MSVRQLMDIEATRLTPGQVDLWPRIRAGLALERRRARQRRALTSAGALVMLFGWLGVAPVGGWLPGAANTVVPTAMAAEMTPVPASLAATAVPAPAPTATVTITPLAPR